MNHSDAAKILSLSGDITPEIVKTAYRKACITFHPDKNPAGLEMMKAVNLAYKTLKDVSENIDNSDLDYSEKLNDAINAIINIEGLIVEICGSWVWLSGNTKPHKNTIKTAGYFWASKKRQWYFRPSDYKSRSRGGVSMDKIRDMHGSTHVKAKDKKQIK